MTSVGVGQRYRLVRRIAVGGMGEVWEAEDGVLNRPVAVKLLRDEYVSDPAFRARFRSEARLTAGLIHPGIAQVFDYGEPGRHTPAYLVMELVRGEPLSATIARLGRLPTGRALDVVGQAATAVDVAHATGLVHRDLKPANLLITPEGRVKVTDFGIARAADDAALTRTGEVIGSAHYLSPEQALGQPATPASDVYALGLVLYECLAGRRPFTEGGPLAIARAHVDTPPPPLPADVPVAVRTLVDRMLAKNPALRPQRAGEVASAIAAVKGGPAVGGALATARLPVAAGATAVAAAGATGTMPATAPPGGPRPTAAWVWVVISVLAVLVGVAAWTVLTDRDPSVPGSGAATASGSGQPSVDSPAPSSPPPSRPSSSPAASSPAAPPPVTITLDPVDYVGRDAAAVAAELGSIGLVVEQRQLVDEEVVEGTVLGLEPTTGLAAGDTVTLLVAQAPTGDTRGEGGGTGEDGGTGEGEGGDG